MQTTADSKLAKLEVKVMDYLDSLNDTSDSKWIDHHTTRILKSQVVAVEILESYSSPVLHLANGRCCFLGVMFDSPSAVEEYTFTSWLRGEAGYCDNSIPTSRKVKIAKVIAKEGHRKAINLLECYRTEGGAE